MDLRLAEFVLILICFLGGEGDVDRRSPGDKVKTAEYGRSYEKKYNKDDDDFFWLTGAWYPSLSV